jgi:alkylation response protein AidB-like acyl-CoA dehydrogenase
MRERWPNGSATRLGSTWPTNCLGGLGYNGDTLVERCLRRTQGWMIAGGSVEILRNRIAESVFDRRFNQRG